MTSLLSSRWRLSRTLVVCGGLLCVLGLSSGSARAKESDDWNAWNKLRVEFGKKKLDAQPAELVAQMEQFAQRPDLHPVVLAEVDARIAYTMAARLKNIPGALEFIASARAQNKGDDPALGMEAIYLEAEAEVMQDYKKNNFKTQTLLEENFKSIEAGLGSEHPVVNKSASRALERLCRVRAARRAAGKEVESNIPVLEDTLKRHPLYLDPQRQEGANGEKGWMYEQLVGSLAAAGRVEEALSWGRLYFGLSPFNSEATARAMQPLNSLWAGKSEFGKVRAFAAAQVGEAEAEAKDEAATEAAPIAPNPLNGVALPDLGDKGAVVAERERLRLLPKGAASFDEVADLITLEIATGQWAAAMKHAQSLVTRDVTSPEGPQQVARVFKAHDSSVARGNQFLAHVEGKAPNPVPAFLAQVAAQEAKS